MIWIVLAATSAIVFGIFLWLLLSKPPESILVDPSKLHWSALDDVDPNWVAMSRKARERYWKENP